MMSLINASTGALVDALILPFRDLPPIAGLIVVSLVTALGVVLAFRRFADRQRIAALERAMQAELFEIRLFKDDLRAILRAQAAMVGHNLRYLRASFVPFAVMAVPMALLVAQLQFRYGYEGLRPGEAALVSATIRDAREARPEVDLIVPSGVRVDDVGAGAPGLGEVTWRIVPERAGEHELTLRAGDVRATKRLVVLDRVARRAPWRAADEPARLPERGRNRSGCRPGGLHDTGRENLVPLHVGRRCDRPTNNPEERAASARRHRGSRH